MLLANKKTLTNIVLNAIATILPLAVLQVFVYPNVSRTLGDDSYALMLTIYSVWVLVSGTLAGAINSSKIVAYAEYVNNKLNGDYPLIIKKWLAITSVVCFVAIWYYLESFYLLHIVLGVIVSCLMFIQMYLECGFRIDIDYKNLLINKIVLSIGYVIGYFLTYITKYWEFIFVFGYGLSILFCMLKSSIKNEKSIKTILYKRTISDCYMYATSNFISNAVNYADKLVLYPLIDSASLSIYYVSTLLGKVASTGASTIRDVLLSYLSKENKNDKKIFAIFVVAITCIVTLGYFVIVNIGKVLLAYLYPTLISEVIIYLPIATIISMLDVVAVIIHPFTLKYCSSKWQVLFSASYGISYFIFSLVLWKMLGLKGFYYGGIIGQIIRIVLMLAIYFKKS